SCYGPKAPEGKSAGTKLEKKQALATVKQTLEQCNEYETTSKSSFTDNESGQRCPQIIPFKAAISNGMKGKRSISSVSKVEDDEPPLDFSHLEIPKMDVFGDAIGEQSLDVALCRREYYDCRFDFIIATFNACRYFAGYEVAQMLYFVLISQRVIENVSDATLEQLRVTLGRLLPHAKGLRFKPRRGGFPLGAKKE
nr:hypothetical protein [Tanacetum cinerariifolium]